MLARREHWKLKERTVERDGTGDEQRVGQGVLRQEVLRRGYQTQYQEKEEWGNGSAEENGKVAAERKERGWKLECKGKWESGY